MDSRAISDRTASWQAKAAYRAEFAFNESEEVLDDLRAAYERWQYAVRAHNEREWSWEIEEASCAAAGAMDAMMKLSQRETSGSTRKKRERWTKARATVSDLQAAHEASKEQVRLVREAYVELLDKTES